MDSESQSLQTQVIRDLGMLEAAAASPPDCSPRRLAMFFMGQEFLEDKQWSDNPSAHPGNLIWWDGLDTGADRAMVSFHRFMEELVRLRRSQPALRGERLNVFHRHNDNRIIAFHRWIEEVGQDVVVVASLNDHTFYGYELGWPAAGYWREAFNSDVYEDHAHGPAGNGGSTEAWWTGRDNLSATARLTIPANSVLVFVR